MTVSDRWLFWTPTLIWASTWHIILFQLAETSAVTGVAWRFALAALMLVGYALHARIDLHVPWRLHGWLAVTGVFQYGINYACVYESERYIPSGLVAVLFSVMVFVNALTGRLFFGRALSLRFALCALGGVAGVALIFWPEVVEARARPHAGLGLLVGLIGVASSCTGNVLTLKLNERGITWVPLLAWCMVYGALMLAVFTALSGQDLQPGHTIRWWLSLSYLAALGSVVAFLTYFKLAQRRGPGSAAMTSVLIPVIALLVSAALENWRPHALSLVGIAVCLGSVWWAARDPARA